MVVDPTHPLAGRAFPLVALTAPRLADHVVIRLPTGQHRAVPRAATDLAPPASPGSSHHPTARVSGRTLLPLATLVHALLTAYRERAHDPAAHRPAPPATVPAATPPTGRDAGELSAADLARVGPRGSAATGAGPGRADAPQPAPATPEGGPRP